MYEDVIGPTRHLRGREAPNTQQESGRVPWWRDDAAKIPQLVHRTDGPQTVWPDRASSDPRPDPGVLRVTDVERQPFRSVGFVSVIVVSGLFPLGLVVVML